MTSPAQTPGALLLNVARLASDNEGVVRVTEVGQVCPVVDWQGADVWDEALELAAAHGMRPLLYRALVGQVDNLSHQCSLSRGPVKDDLNGASKLSTIPDHVTVTLQDFTRQNLRKNLRMTGELILLLRLFAERGVNVIPFKGPTLAALAYGDLGLREFGDLDLLIARPDFMKAQEALIAQGYQPEMLLNAHQAEVFAQTCNVMAFWHPRNEISVELHWELSPKYLPFSPDFERLRQRMVPSYPGGKAVMTLSPEDMLVYLCAHGAKHAWGRLMWIADVAGLIHRHSNLDWGRIHDLAVEQRCERVLSLGLRLARDMAGVTLPAEAEELIRNDHVSEKLAREVAQWLFPDPGGRSGLWGQTLFLFKLQRRWTDKISSFARLAMTPSAADWMSFINLRQFAGLYPLLRPMRLISKLISSSR